MQTVLQYIHNTAAYMQDAPAIICDERVVSYGDFVSKIHSLSELFKEAGLRKGDRAAVFLKDKTEFMASCYALMNIGAIAVPISENATMHLLQEIVRDCAPSLFVTSAVDVSEIPQLRSKVTGNLFLIEERDRVADYSHSIVLREKNDIRFSGNGKQNPDVSPDDRALIWYTSGSIGEQHGIVFSQKNLINGILSANKVTRITADTRECITAPLTHTFGFIRTCRLFAAGGTAIVSNTVLNPVSIVQSVLRYRCNTISLIPSVFVSMLDYNEPLIKRIAGQIVSVELGASSMSVAQKHRILNLFPSASVCMHYGTMEAPYSTVLHFRDMPDKLDSSGRAFPDTEIGIMDSHNQHMLPLETGEIAVRGGHVMLEYWNNPKLTREAVTEDGWFRTGDSGFMDHDGFLHIVGRNDEMIVMGGLKFSPLEIEREISKHFPDHQICVIGIPDPGGILGEIPVLCYLANNGKTITASDLSRALSHTIDKGKIPRIVYRIDGGISDQQRKLTRKDLRAKFLEQFPRSPQHQTEPPMIADQHGT